MSALLALFTLQLSLQSCGGADFTRVLEVPRVLTTEPQGTLRVLTYNVAGLPATISSSSPDVNTRQASPLLNHYDVVLAQEDFSYHADLVHAARHPYQMAPRGADRAFVGDGLTTLSNLPLDGEHRVEWQVCNGYLFSLNDCLGEKGFSVAQIWLGPGSPVQVYNLHADAGDDDGDFEARQAGFRQLAQHIATHSAGVALIVGGDTNLNESDPRDRATLAEFLRRTGLTDSCRSLQCPRNELDRVFYRSSIDVRLKAVAWSEDVDFVDASGQALSDHPAVGVALRWEVPQDLANKRALAQSSPLH